MTLPTDEEIDKALAAAGIRAPDELREAMRAAVRAMQGLAAKLRAPA
jgi:hypothetical protein